MLDAFSYDFDTLFSRLRFLLEVITQHVLLLPESVVDTLDTLLPSSGHMLEPFLENLLPLGYFLFA